MFDSGTHTHNIYTSKNGKHSIDSYYSKKDGPGVGYTFKPCCNII